MSHDPYQPPTWVDMALEAEFPDLEKKMNNPENAFVVHRLSAKPVEYTVRITHFVSGGEWVMGASVHDVAGPDAVQRERVAADLRNAADLVETADWVAVPPEGRQATEIWQERAALAEDFIRRHGYRKCDIAACNCGSWHGGDAMERLLEIEGAIREAGISTNGQTILGAVKSILAIHKDTTNA